MLIRGLVPALLVALLGCSSGGATNECEDLPSSLCVEPDGGVPDAGDPDRGEPDGGVQPGGGFVVDVAWLAENLNHPDVQLIDTRASGYHTSRIPGAIHLLPAEVVTTVDGVRAQVAPPEQAEAVLRAKGLRNGVTAVVYGEPLEYDPSRVVWTLSYYGHGDVRYLDGGYRAWIDSGGELDTDPPTVEESDYTITALDDSLRATGEWVLEQLGEEPYEMPAIQLVDARSEGEYESGRIPTALSVNWTRNLEAGFVLQRSDLEALYEGLDPSRATVTYCVTGWRGSFAWLTLTALGYQDVRLYDGSWSEWGNGDFPVEQ